MSDFLKRARAEAYRRWGYFIDQAGIENVRQAGGFIEGAEWARRELLADPTEAEVEAVAEVLVTERYLMRAVSLESARKDAVMWRADVEFLRPQARAVIAYFLEARRGRG